MPESIQKYAERLRRNRVITKNQFIVLCDRALDLISNASSDRRAVEAVAYEITGLWLRYNSVNEDELLNEISMPFSDWECGSWVDPQGADKQVIHSLRSSLRLAQAKYKVNQPPPAVTKMIPDVFRGMCEEYQSRTEVSDRDYIYLCTLAAPNIDALHTDERVRTGIAYYLYNIWNSHDNIGAIYEPVDSIGAQFGCWVESGGFPLNTILDQHMWNNTKLRITDVWSDIVAAAGS